MIPDVDDATRRPLTSFAQSSRFTLPTAPSWPDRIRAARNRARTDDLFDWSRKAEDDTS
jgi:hypothetical protein